MERTQRSEPSLARSLACEARRGCDWWDVDVECGIWIGDGIWDLGYGIWDMQGLFLGRGKQGGFFFF